MVSRGGGRHALSRAVQFWYVDRYTLLLRFVGSGETPTRSGIAGARGAVVVVVHQIKMAEDGIGRAP